MTKECLVLTQVGNMELLHSKGGRSKWNLGKRDTLFLQSCPSSLFLRGLKQVFDKGKRPLLIEIEAALPDRIDFLVIGDFMNLGDIRQQLKRYGLDIVVERRAIDRSEEQTSEVQSLMSRTNGVCWMQINIKKY